MTRLIVGPFNRVEGDLEVKLDIQDGRVHQAQVVSPLYRGFERILAGKPPLDALVYAPRICGICSVSQSVAAAKSLAAAMGLSMPANGELAVNLIHAAENVADHLTHFYLFFMPDFVR
ncbi:HupV protein [Stappia aggregata IAM 12614]